VENVWDHQVRELPCDAVVTVTARLPDDALYQALLLREAEWPDAGIRSLRCIGDAEAPGLIAHAVYAGHRYARDLEEPVAPGVPFKRHFHVTEM
jgi:dimethylamine/trimethylamine dehydrogenase